jgi:hypothetical protein
MVSGVRYTVAERGLWATSALTLMNARNAGWNGNVARQITKTSALIPLRRFARSAGLKDPQELRLYGKAKNEKADYLKAAAG